MRVGHTSSPSLGFAQDDFRTEVVFRICIGITNAYTKRNKGAVIGFSGGSKIRRGRGSNEADNWWCWRMFTQRLAKTRPSGDPRHHEPDYSQRSRHAAPTLTGKHASALRFARPLNGALFLFVDVELLDAVEDVPDAGDKSTQTGGVQRPLERRGMNLEQNPAKRDHLK